MIPQGYEITGDMVPRVRNILGVPDRRDTGPHVCIHDLAEGGGKTWVHVRAECHSRMR